jgi:hypothetical protein
MPQSDGIPPQNQVLTVVRPGPGRTWIERIRYTDRFDALNLPETIQGTVTFKAVSCGTKLTITQEGIPDVIPAEVCYLGW